MIKVGDIFNYKAECYINPANSCMQGGLGLDYIFHKKAGKELSTYMQKYFSGVPVGQAVISPGFNLDAKIIHAVAPIYNKGSQKEFRLLKQAYDSAFKLAIGNGCKTIATPLLGAGNYGIPYKKSMDAAISTANVYKSCFKTIYLVIRKPMNNNSIKLNFSRWECCGNLWQIITHPLFPERYDFAPLCADCGKQHAPMV